MKKTLVIVAVLSVSVSAVAAPSFDGVRNLVAKLMRGKSTQAKNVGEIGHAPRIAGLNRETRSVLIENRALAVLDSGTAAVVTPERLIIEKAAGMQGHRVLTIDIPTNGGTPYSSNATKVVKDKALIKDPAKRAESPSVPHEEAFLVRQGDLGSGTGADFRWTVHGELDFAHVTSGGANDAMAYTSIRNAPGQYNFSATKRFITGYKKTSTGREYPKTIDVTFSKEIELAPDEILESIKSIERVGNETDRLQLQIVVRNIKPGSAPSVRDILVKDEVTQAMDRAKMELAITHAIRGDK